MAIDYDALEAYCLATPALAHPPVRIVCERDGVAVAEAPYHDVHEAKRDWATMRAEPGERLVFYTGTRARAFKGVTDGDTE